MLSLIFHNSRIGKCPIGVLKVGPLLVEVTAGGGKELRDKRDPPAGIYTKAE